MKQTLVLAAALALVSVAAVAEVPPADQQIAAATLAAPEDRRDSATVLGYDAGGNLATLREGTNDLVCLAAAPDAERYSVACYHTDLEPFMARARASLLIPAGTST